jgi:hypothetical protein
MLVMTVAKKDYRGIMAATEILIEEKLKHESSFETLLIFSKY